jgi:hypothetical protein
MIVLGTDLLPRVPRDEYLPEGIFPSEIAIFSALCRYKGIHTVLESGRKYGYSTRCLRRDPRLQVISYENDPDSEVDKHLSFFNLQVRTGSSEESFPKLVEEFRAIQIPLALLINSPKGTRAWNLGVTLCSHVGSPRSLSRLSALHQSKQPIWWCCLLQL